MAFLKKAKAPKAPQEPPEVLFEDRKTVQSMGWTTTDFVANHFKTKPEKIMAIEMNSYQEAKRLADMAAKQEPPLNLLPEGICLCYLPEDERQLYDFLEQQKEQPVPAEPEKGKLDEMIARAQKKRMDRKEVLDLVFGEARQSSLNAITTDAQKKEKAKEILSLLADSADEQVPELPKRPNRKRDYSIHVMFSDSEYHKLKQRVAYSGLTQAEYLRKATLTGPLPGREESELVKAQIRYAEALSILSAELGRQGGMLKQNMRYNSDKEKTAPSEWSSLVEFIRFLERYARIFGDALDDLNRAGKQKRNRAQIHTVTIHLEETTITVKAKGIALRDICLPSEGPRSYTQEDWMELVHMCKEMHAQYADIVAETVREINGCR